MRRPAQMMMTFTTEGLGGGLDSRQDAPESPSALAADLQIHRWGLSREQLSWNTFSECIFHF